jgi:hypothetical protein
MDEIQNKEQNNNNISILHLIQENLFRLHSYWRDLLFVPIHFLLILIILLTVILIVLSFYLYNQLFGHIHIYDDDQNLELNKKYPLYFNPEMTYYVCSFGGCGSYMLCNYLRNFGKVEHIHSRNPPSKLEYIGANNTSRPVYGEWFNKVQIPETELDKFKVIYLYKDPVKAIYSRFENPEHLLHIECDDTSLTLEQVIQNKADLYKLEEFFDNYTKTKKSNTKKRNYPIYCVKYEEFWNHVPEFNHTIGLPDIPALYPVKKETLRKEPYSQILYKIYSKLLKKMKKKKFIEKV